LCYHVAPEETKLNPSLDQLVVSSCSNPELDAPTILERYARLGYRKFEVFTSWAKSHFDYHRDPAEYLALGSKYGWRFTSFHLPPVGDDIEAGLKESIAAANFAKALGCDVMLFKASSRPNYIKAARPFLDAVEGLGVTPVLQNHWGTPISTLEDFREVLEGINDPRMKTLLEVGMFHTAGVPWRQGYELLKDKIALVHIKDQIGQQPVKFGKGEIDLRGLFIHMRHVGYTGSYVVEMEAARGDTEKSIELLGHAREYFGRMFETL
jgi:sugar phosphate isomerase/epimerase